MLYYLNIVEHCNNDLPLSESDHSFIWGSLKLWALSGQKKCLSPSKRLIKNCTNSNAVDLIFDNLCIASKAIKEIEWDNLAFVPQSV